MKGLEAEELDTFAAQYDLPPTFAQRDYIGCRVALPSLRTSDGGCTEPRALLLCHPHFVRMTWEWFGHTAAMVQRRRAAW